jgi:hypothetical protein
MKKASFGGCATGRTSHHLDPSMINGMFGDDGVRLTGTKRYTMTFQKTPPTS